MQILGCLWAEKAESRAALGWLPVREGHERGERKPSAWPCSSVSPQQCKNAMAPRHPACPASPTSGEERACV